MKYIELALLTIFHPTDAYDEIKLRCNKLSIIPSLLIFLIVIINRYIYVLCVHLPLADIKIQDTNILLEVGRILIPVLTAIVSIYAVSSILYGETSLKMIFISISYAFVPFILINSLLIIISRFMALTEVQFFGVMTSIMWFWILALIFFGIMLMNNYSFGKTILVSLISIVGIALIWAVVIMIIALSFQIIGFVNEVVKEYVFSNL